MIAASPLCVVCFCFFVFPMEKTSFFCFFSGRETKKEENLGVLPSKMVVLQVFVLFLFCCIFFIL